MIQTILVLLLFFISVGYLVKKFIFPSKSGSGCDGCATAEFSKKITS